MFAVETKSGRISGVFATLLLIHANTARQLRGGYRRASTNLIMSILQTIIMLGVFYLMMTLLGMKGMAIRGDYIVYLLTGVFTYMFNIQTMRGISKAGNPTSAMLQHAPMTTAIAILSSALATLYLQVLSVIVILTVYDLAVGTVEIDNPVGFAGMLLLAWFNGVSVGLIMLAGKPWLPKFFSIAENLYVRANMVFSGKMFVANTLGYSLLICFYWNPLFHIIDQARGYAFLNYSPHVTNVTYPIVVTVILTLIGLLGEFFTRRHVSASWAATQ